jgi:hypothetical protein
MDSVLGTRWYVITISIGEALGVVSLQKKTYPYPVENIYWVNSLFYISDSSLSATSIIWELQPEPVRNQPV